MAFPQQFGSPTPVVITDASGNTGTSANLPVIDASVGALNAAGPVFCELIGWLDGAGKLQAVSAANPLPVTSAGGGGGGAVTNAGTFAVQASITTLGQALAAASVPVVLPAAQITTLTPPAAITGFALEAGNLASIKADTDKIPALGQALAAASVPVVLTAAQLTTLTPPASVSVSNFPATQAVSLASMPSTPVTGTFFQTTQPVSAASLPLPSNAAQETGGNLAAIAASQATTALQTRNDAQAMDVLCEILAQLRLLNMNFASCAPSALVDQDGMVTDIFPVN
jgi:hypothetical protein